MSNPREQSIFIQALEREPPERDAFLDDACATDPALRRRVERLLHHHHHGAGFLATPAVAAAAGQPESDATARSDGALTEQPGTVIGHYKLLEPIGEGGMGVVFLAEQQRPVRRQVALKVIKAGMDTRQVIARFEAERQALALMDHPSIARVLDAGATDGGRPYFVMELVRGVPITRYCDDQRLTPRQRLELFVQVCQAVQHAHTKGVIHRDLKPGNVLVALYDGRPVPKVIDFGVAKATGPRLTEQTVFTGFGAFVGTPEYMSPEQAELNQLDVDTRSDVYSLGVLLYELLTGTTPLQRERFREAALLEVLRVVREEEPPRPSTRLGTAQELPAIAERRGLEPRKLRGLVKGELDWIAMRALEKDRARRYETANGLARDVERYLRDEPVQACPPSNWYRFRKLARRNRGTFAAAAAGVAVILLAVATLAVASYLVKQAKDRAEAAQGLAEFRAEENRQGLERLKEATAQVNRGHWYNHVKRWDDSQAAFTKAIELRPDHVAAWFERGELFCRLGLWDLAREDFAREFELREPATTLRWYQRAVLMVWLADLDDYHRLRVRMRERFLGTLDDMFAAELVRACALADSPEDELASLITRAEFNLRRTASRFNLYVLGLAHHRAGRHEQAVLRLRQSLDLPPDHFNKAMAYPVLAMAHHRLGQTDQAREALRSAAQTIDLWTSERYGGNSQADSVTHHGATAVWPVLWWDWLECLMLFREAKLLIDGAPPADDDRFHVLRARSFVGIRQHALAAAAYAAALELAPDNPQIRFEARRSAAYAAAHRGQWNDAATQFVAATDLALDDAALWYMRAVSQLAAGDKDAYRRTCGALIQRVDKTTVTPRSAVAVVAACVLDANALPDMAMLVPLGERACNEYLSAAPTRATALYRAGRYVESLDAFDEGARICRPRAYDLAFRAMALHRLGRVDEARRSLNDALRWIDEANRRSDDDLTGTLPAWGAWTDRVEYPLVVREAQAMLNGKPGTGADRPESR